MIRNYSSPIKQIQYASKLKMIDTHQIRTEMGSNTVNLEYENMLKVMALKLALEPAQQILPFTAKTVIFDTFSTRSFTIKQQIAPKQNNFILNVNTYVHIKLEVKVNDKGSKIYHFQGNKAIQIFEQSFNEISITATVQKIGIFSSVKFYLDLIQVQYVSPKKVSAILRPNIDKQLQQFLANNRGKSAEILRNRSLTRSKQMMMRKTAISFKPIKNIELIRSKSQFQNFQKKKSLYIKHVRKMSPARERILKENEQKYHYSKKEQMTQLSLIIYTAKLGMILYQTRLKQAAYKIKQMKITMLCADFIKIIKNKFRLKMTQKARLRMNFHHTIQFLPTIMRSTTLIDAKKVLLEALTPYMNYRTVQQLGSNSQDYVNSTVKIQKYSKMKSKQLRERVQLLIQILIKSEKIDIDRSRIPKIVEKYILICRNKGRWSSKIYQQKQQLILLLRKNGIQ